MQADIGYIKDGLDEVKEAIKDQGKDIKTHIDLSNSQEARTDLKLENLDGRVETLEEKGKSIERGVSRREMLLYSGGISLLLILIEVGLRLVFHV